VSAWQLALAALAGAAAGAVNALAGGGTLISFPALLALGLPPLAANIANTIALCPGYVGAVYAQRADLRGQFRRVRVLLPIALAGGLAGALLLVRTRERAFGQAVPWLLLGACALLAAQERLRARLAARAARRQDDTAGDRTWNGLPALLALPLVAAAAIYSGYFGAGASVIALAALGVAFADTLPRLNALKQVASFGSNCAAALLFAATATVNWQVVSVMALGAIVGGAGGGRLARSLSPRLLRGVVLLLGISVAVVYLLRSS
jgi:uncharacterized membrane protein YfcA